MLTPSGVMTVTSTTRSVFDHYGVAVGRHLSKFSLGNTVVTRIQPAMLCFIPVKS